MLRAAIVAAMAAQAAAFAATGSCVPALRLPAHTTRPQNLRGHGVVCMSAEPAAGSGMRATVKKLVATGALSLCLLAGTPMRASAQATATEFDFEEDLLEEETSLVESAEVEIDYTGLRKLTMAEEVAKYGILAGIFGGGVAWSWYEGKREDRDEEERVKAEVERIEKWKKEFIDMDDVVSDDDMLASLQKRMSGEGADEVKDMDGKGGVAEDYDPEAAVLQAQLKKMEEEAQKKEEEQKKKEEEEDNERFNALKAEISEDESADKVAEIDTEQMERLKKMFGSSEDKKE